MFTRNYSFHSAFSMQLYKIEENLDLLDGTFDMNLQMKISKSAESSLKSSLKNMN